MFKRREPLTAPQKAKEMIWPSMGLKRAMVYLKHRIVRIADSTPKVALGLAIGFGVSFTPILGTHFVQAGILAYLMRGNIFAAIIGTFVGNPWTFPFFWWAGFSFGRVMFDVFGIPGGQLPDELSFSILWDLIWSEPLTVFLPWVLGGYLLCLITTPIAYFIYHRLVNLAKLARRRAIMRKKKIRTKS